MSLCVMPQIMPLHQTLAYHSNESGALPNMAPSLAYPSAATSRYIHIDIGAFLWQGLPQATIAVQLDWRTRLAGPFWPPVPDAHRGNEAPKKKRLS